MFKGVNIHKLNGLLGNTSVSTDSVMMLIYRVAENSLPDSVQFNTSYELKQLRDLEDLGFTISHDANEKILVHHSVREVFRLAPQSVLHLLLVKDTLETSKDIMEDQDVQTVIRSLKEVKGIGIMGTEDTYLSLIDDVEHVQAVVDQFAQEKRLLDFILLPGYGVLDNDSYYNLSAFPDYREKGAGNVSIVIAQDPNIAALEEEYKYYVDIGAVLGMIGVRQVNENIGSVDVLRKPDSRKGEENYSLTGIEEWQEANLSDGRSFSTLSFVDQQTLNEKGYIYAGNFEGYDGIYFSGSGTCVSLNSDYSYIENNRTWNKAARAIRASLLPLVRGVVKKDPETGYIRMSTISEWESKVNRALEEMVIADEISGYDVFIDPKQIPSESNPLEVKALVVKDGIVHEFNVDLGLSNNV